MIEKLKNNKKLLRLLTIIVLILACCNLPSLLFFPLCLKEDFFRPPHTEVLVSACKRPGTIGIPGGEILLIGEGGTKKSYMLDLHTGKKNDIPNDLLLMDKGIFLSSELIWLEGSVEGPGDINYRPHYILDLTTGKRYELLDLDVVPRMEDGKFDPKYYAYFRSAERVFIHHSRNSLIALSPNFREHPEQNVIFSQIPLEVFNENYEDGELLVRLMKDLRVDYEIVDFSLQYADVPSPTGRYIVRKDGVYLSGSNTPIVARYMEYNFRSWYYDESGIVFQELGSFLINSPLLGSHYSIPKPILKLRLLTIE